MLRPNGKPFARPMGSRAGLLACVVAVLGHGPGLGGEGAPAPTQRDEVVQLVEDLGSPNWERREAAQGRLLELGLEAVPPLEEAAGSENVELAHRARYILERIDPEVVDLRILKVEFGPPPALREAASVVGRQGETLIARTFPEDINAPRFEATYRRAGGDRIEVDLARTVQGGLRLELPGPLGRPNVVSRIFQSDESTYRRMGLRLQRTRTSFLTLSWIRRGRQSNLGPTGESAAREVTLDELVAALVAQAEDPELRVRREAWQILAELSPPGASSLFRQGTAAPETREVALLGLSEVEGLLEILASPREPKTGMERIQVPRAPTIAAIRLARAGNPDGIRHLVERLQSSNGLEFHSVAATLADIDADSMEEPLRSRLLGTAFDRDTLVRAPWDDVETEHFYARLVDLLDPRAENDRAILSGLLETVEHILRAGPTERRPDAKTCMDVWRRAALRLPEGERPSSLSFLLRVLPAVRGSDAFADIMTLVEESFYASGAGVRTGSGPRIRSESVSRSELRTLCDALSTHVESDDPELVGKSHQWLVRLSRSLTPRKGELAILVEALIRSAEAVSALFRENADVGTGSGLTRFSVAQTEQELARWTGLPAPRRATTAPPEESVEFDATPWREWLSSRERVLEREAALDSQEAATDTSQEETVFAYYEFDLELRPKEGSPAAASTAQEFRVLDGRRLEIPPRVPTCYRDRWGNELCAILEPIVTPGARGPERIRLNRRSLLYAGVPVLTTVYERELEVVRVEVSDVFDGSRPILHNKDSLPTFRNLLLVLPLDTDVLRGSSPTDRQGEGAQELWQAFLESHILGIEPNAMAQQRTSVLSIVRALDIPGRSKVLRRLFESAPTAELARLLHESGDTAGLQWLEQQLRGRAGKSRWDAALELSELGGSEGAQVLIEEYRKDPTSLKRYSYQILNALDGYLQRARRTDPIREQVLDFVYDQLSDPLFQYRAFRLVERETGTDFGYREARATSDPRESRPKVEEAVQRAHAWRIADKARDR